MVSSAARRQGRWGGRDEGLPTHAVHGPVLSAGGSAMSDFFAAYRPLIELFLLHTGYAFSQYIVLRAGVFSVANAGFAAIGAYLAAILTVRYGLPAPIAV